MMEVQCHRFSVEDYNDAIQFEVKESAEHVGHIP